MVWWLNSASFWITGWVH